MASKYSEADIAKLSTQNYKSLTSYEQRLVRGHNRGLSRSQSRGHARTTKGEKPVSTIKKQRPSAAAPGAQKQKPSLSKSGKSGKKNLGRHVTKQYNQQGEVRRTRINARTSESLGKQLNRTPDSQGVIIHLIDRNGNVVKAVGQGKKHTASAGYLKKRIADNLAGGASWDDAVFDAIGESFDFYDEDGNYVADISSMSFTNIIMYAE